MKSAILVSAQTAQQTRPTRGWKRWSVPLFAAVACLSLGGWNSQAYQVRIMPLGDSITSGLDGQVTYRAWLWNWLNQAGFSVNFVGTQSGVFNGEPAYTDFDLNHEGHAGLRSDVIADSVRSWALKTRPQIVLLMAGSQDVAEGFPVAFTVNNLSRIIQNLRRVNPFVTIMLAKLPPIQSKIAEVDQVNGGITWLARQLNRRYSRVIVVDENKGFSPETILVDGFNLNETGERKIATRWFYALMPVLRAYGQYQR